VTEAKEARLAQLEADIEALNGEPVFDPADIGTGGVFVSLGFDSGLPIERGFIRKADEAPASRVTVEGEADGPAVSAIVGGDDAITLRRDQAFIITKIVCS
jgi:ParB family chromosome partitioning protein